MAPADLHAKLLKLLAPNHSPSPVAVVHLLEALELRRAHAVKMTSELRLDSSEEEEFIASVRNCLGHSEASRRFYPIDMLWRCLSVESSIDQEDFARALETVGLFFALRADTPSRYKDLGSPEERADLALFDRNFVKRVAALGHGKKAGGGMQRTAEEQKRYLGVLRKLTADWVNTVAPLVKAMDAFVEQLQADPSPERPSDDSQASLPTPSPTTFPLVGASSPPSASKSSLSSKHSLSQSRTSRKRTREQSNQHEDAQPRSQPESRPLHPPATTAGDLPCKQTLPTQLGMDVDDTFAAIDDVTSWIDQLSSPPRSQEARSDVPTPRTMLSSPAAAPPVHPRAIATSFFSQEEVQATQPPQAAVPPSMISKIQQGARANARKLEEEQARAAEQKKGKGKGKERAVAPSMSRALMPPPAAGAKSSGITPSGSGGTSNSLPPAAQPLHSTSSDQPSSSFPRQGDELSQDASSSQPLVLVPNTQSTAGSNDRRFSQEDVYSQPIERQAQQQVETQDTQGSGTTATTDSLEYVSREEAKRRERITLARMAREAEEAARGEKHADVPASNRSPKSFHELDDEATAGLDDEEEVSKILLDNASSM